MVPHPGLQIPQGPTPAHLSDLTSWHPLPFLASLVAQSVKRLPAMRETQVQLLGQEDPLEKNMATHSSILAWEIPRTEAPGKSHGQKSLGLQPKGLQRVRHDLTTK